MTLAGLFAVAVVIVLALFRMCYLMGHNAAAIEVINGVFMPWLDRTRGMPDGQRRHALAEYDRAWQDFKAAFPTEDPPLPQMPFVRVAR